DHPQSGFADCISEYYYGINSIGRKSFRRDSSNTFYGGCLFSSQAAAQYFRPGHGAALPPLCNFNQRNQHHGIKANGVWNSIGAYRNCFVSEYCCQRTAQVFWKQSQNELVIYG